MSVRAVARSDGQSSDKKCRLEQWQEVMVRAVTRSVGLRRGMM